MYFGSSNFLHFPFSFMQYSWEIWREEYYHSCVVVFWSSSHSKANLKRICKKFLFSICYKKTPLEVHISTFTNVLIYRLDIW